jgi:hypothetical protein
VVGEEDLPLPLPTRLEEMVVVAVVALDGQAMSVVLRQPDKETTAEPVVVLRMVEEAAVVVQTPPEQTVEETARLRVRQAVQVETEPPPP